MTQTKTVQAACGLGYLTCVKTDSSDDGRITEDPAGFAYIDDGMFRCRKHYGDSRRNTYLFLSADLLEKGYRCAQPRLEND